MTNITLFCGTKNQITFDLKNDLSLVYIDEMDNDLLVTVDLCGITIEYISTSEGLELDSAYIMDGGYSFLRLEEFDNQTLKNHVEQLVMENI
ncbi:MAG: hypothetical protein RSB94_07235 [Erysipelotrichaceae bacterium]